MKRNWKLLVILLLAAVLRMWSIGRFPVHLTPDEAALGYNAFSILQTGKDEYGSWFPVIFKSFGDYKPGLYVYLSIPFVAILGLTETAVRLPSAIAGTMAVWLVYLLARLLVSVETKIWRFSKAEISNFPYIAALVLALNPWHIHFSRAAWESNVAITMIIAMVYLFVRAVELKDKNALLGAAIVASLSLWMYQGAKMATPLAGLGLLLVYWKPFLKLYTWKQIFVLGVLCTVIAMPVVFTFFTGKAGRLAVFSILAYRRPQAEIEQLVLQPAGIEVGSSAFVLFHGEWLAIILQLCRRYFNYFSGRYLFFEGDWMHPHMSSPYLGMFYPVDLVLLVAGVWFALKKPSRLNSVLLLWLLLSPLPATFSRDEVNGVRSLPMVFPIAWFVSLGGYGLWQWLRTFPQVPQRMLKTGLLAVYLGFFVYYLDMYYVVAPQKTADAHYYGYKQIVAATQEFRAAGQTVVVNQSYAQPYIYFLFYEQYDPTTYQQEAYLHEHPFGDVGLIERVHDQLLFRPINWSADQQQQGVVFAADSLTTITAENSDDPAKFNTKIIAYPNGEEAFRVVEVL